MKNQTGLFWPPQPQLCHVHIMLRQRRPLVVPPRPNHNLQPLRDLERHLQDSQHLRIAGFLFCQFWKSCYAFLLQNAVWASYKYIRILLCGPFHFFTRFLYEYQIWSPNFTAINSSFILSHFRWLTIWNTPPESGISYIVDCKTPQGLRHDLESSLGMLPLQQSPPFLASKNFKNLGFKKGSKKLTPSQNYHSDATRKLILPKNPLQKKSSHFFVGRQPSEISPHDKLPKPNISGGGEVTTGFTTGAGEAPPPFSVVFFFYPPTKRRGKKPSQNQVAGAPKVVKMRGKSFSCWWLDQPGTWKTLERKYHFFLGILDTGWI